MLSLSYPFQTWALEQLKTLPLGNQWQLSHKAYCQPWDMRSLFWTEIIAKNLEAVNVKSRKEHEGWRKERRNHLKQGKLSTLAISHIWTNTSVFVHWLDFQVCTEITSKNFLQIEHLLVHRDEVAKNMSPWYKGSNSQIFLQKTFLPFKWHEVKATLMTVNRHSHWVLSALISLESYNVKIESFPQHFWIRLSTYM